MPWPFLIFNTICFWLWLYLYPSLSLSLNPLLIYFLFAFSHSFSSSHMNDGCVTTSGDARSSPINIPKLHLISHMTPLSDREDSPIDFPLDISDLNSPKQRPPSPPPSPPLSPPLPLQELCAHLKEPESSCTSGQNSSQAQPRPKAAIERVNGVKDIKSFVRKSARLSLTFDNEPGCSKDDFLLLGDLLKWKEETRCGTPSENQALNASSPSQPGDYESYSSSPLSGSSPIISKIPFLCSDSSERTPSPSHNLRDETGLRSNRSGLHSPRPTVKSLPQDLMSPRKTLLHHDQQPFFELPFDEKKNSPRSISSGRALLLSSPSSSPFSMSFGSGLTALGHKKKRSTVDSNQFRAMTTIFSGFLNFKELHKRSSRKKRWVVLKQEGFLLIYKVPEAELQGSDLKESINLQYSVVKPSRTKTYKFQILSPATSYSFSCDTLSSEWIQTLQSLTEQLMHLMTGAHLSSGDTPSLNTGSEKVRTSFPSSKLLSPFAGSWQQKKTKSVSQGSHRMFKQIASLSSNSHCADCNCNG